MEAKQLVIKLDGTPEENMLCVDTLINYSERRYNLAGFKNGSFIDRNRFPTSPFNTNFWTCKVLMRDRDTPSFIRNLLAVVENKTNVKIHLYELKDTDWKMA